MNDSASEEPGDLPAQVLRDFAPGETRGAKPAALVTSLVVHAGLIGFAFLPQTGVPGAGGNELDAIGIEIVSSDVLETMLHDRTAAASAHVSGDVAKQSADERAIAEPEPESATERQTVEPEARSEEPPVQSSDDNRMSSEPVERPPTDAAQPAAKDSSESGATVVASTASAEDNPARTAAQAGAVRLYLASIRARLAKNRPRGQRQKGIVTITFAIRTNGELANATITKSSGNAALDNAALSAVRRSAPFPVPPGTMTAGELAFTVPYRFD